MIDLRRTKRFVLDSRAWQPEPLRLILATRPGRDRRPTADAGVRLRAAAAWLARAQDATGDGGVSWAYSLRYGWGPSYPETTGYIVPTYLALRDALGDAAWRTRAGVAIDFLVPLQFEEGAFPAGTLARAERTPSIFNTGQIINGLTAWHLETGDDAILERALRAARWLGSVQDDDGAWRRHAHLDYPVTYTAHAACWIAELGVHANDTAVQAIAERHLDWVLGQQDADTGWFVRAGFSAEDHARRESVTHTIAYTLWGVLLSGELLGRADAVSAARRAALDIADGVLARGWLPGMLGDGWMPRSRYACLTGNAQMALVWQKLDGLEPDPRLRAAADRVLDLVGAAQLLTSRDPGIRGGIPGSDPVWGDYVQFGLPNWAAKFTIDALLGQGDPSLRLTRPTPEAAAAVVPAPEPSGPDGPA
jgi:hypothetical protein